jgi:hypothetical protein
LYSVSGTASRSTTVVIPGRWTLTMTCSPERSAARCTWPMDAAASGFCSKWVKTSSTGAPSSAASSSRTSVQGAGTTSSCRLRSSVMNSGGSRSSRVDIS